MNGNRDNRAPARTAGPLRKPRRRQAESQQCPIAHASAKSNKAATAPAGNIPRPRRGIRGRHHDASERPSLPREQANCIHEVQGAYMSDLSRIFSTVALIAFVSAVAPPAIARAQRGLSQHDHAAVHQQMNMKQMKGEMRMPSMDELAARKKANSEKIAALMAKLADARGEDRMAVMAEVLGILVEERAAMQQHCADMHAMMTK